MIEKTIEKKQNKMQESLRNTKFGHVSGGREEIKPERLGQITKRSQLLF